MSLQLESAGNLLLGFFVLVAAGAAVLTLTGFLARSWWVFDLTSHFRPQYAVLLAVAGLVFFVLGRPVLGLSALVFALINLAVIWPVFVRPAQALTEAPVAARRRALILNLYQPNRQHDRVLELIEAVDPDLVVLVEVNERWWRALEPAWSRYPYQQSALREDNYGLAIFSRLPMLAVENQAFCALGVPTIVTQLEGSSHPLTIIGTHPPPPKGRHNTAFRDEQMESLGDFIASQDGEMMVCGDLNLTPWSPVLRRFLQKSGLRDSAQGFGLQASWPVNNPLLRIPIDHCLVSPGIRVNNRELAGAVGSDHFPVVLEFSLP